MSSPADGKAIAYTLNQSPCTWLRILIFEAGPSSGQLANRLLLRTARGIFSRWCEPRQNKKRPRSVCSGVDDCSLGDVIALLRQVRKRLVLIAVPGLPDQ